MTIKDTIKSLEEADEKLNKAIALEEKANVAQHKATAMRDEAQLKLNKAVAEKQKVDELYSAWNAEKAQSEQELKNREITLMARQSDLESQTNERAKALDVRENELGVISHNLVSRETACKVREEEQGLLNRRYASIAEFINNTL